MTDYGHKTGEKRPRFRPFTTGIKPFYSRFRPYKTPFPTVGIIDLGLQEVNILLYMKNKYEDFDSIEAFGQ